MRARSERRFIFIKSFAYPDFVSWTTLIVRSEIKTNDLRASLNETSRFQLLRLCPICVAIYKIHWLEQTNWFALLRLQSYIVWSNKRFYPKQIVYSFFYREHCFYHYIVVMFKIFLKNIVQNMFKSWFNFFFVNRVNILSFWNKTF
jgi:hypothetical protein